MISVTARSPAKINLALRVGPLRGDGFHSLATVFQAIDLYDEVTAHQVDDGEITVSVTGLGAESVPANDSNLAVRAARALASRFSVTQGARLTILKRIPPAGGLAGGSTDAAATLMACDALWRTRASRTDLAEIAADLGSDVPFCLLGGTAVGVGRGELLTPALASGDYHWVLAIDSSGLSTPAVYAEIDRLRAEQHLSAKARRDATHDPAVPEEVLVALRSGEPKPLGRALSNDLGDAALSLRPRLHRVLEAGRDLGALAGQVSGSGPTCMLLARDADHALNLAVGLTTTGLCRTVQRACGPVAGARVVRD